MVSLEEQPLGNSFEKVFIGNAGTATSGLDITDVFSTYLIEGTGQSQAIDNGIDLTEGGLVWIKKRNAAKNHGLMDTEQGLDSGNSRYLISNTTAATATGGQITAYNSDGFTLGTADMTNGNNNSYVSWTFRKAKKFFDIVTYTGNNDPDNSGTSQNIAHNLGSAPGMIIVKRTDDAAAWYVFHRGVNGGTNPENYGMILSDTQAQVDEPWFGDTLPTSSVFTVGPSAGLNGLNFEYIAYVFAHNNNDGEFGPDLDQDIIKCGSFTSDASGAGLVGPDLGFEPQWVLLKNATSTASGNWWLFDSMRGFTATGGGTAYLQADTSGAEGTFGGATLNLTNNGFTMPSNAFAGGQTYIYMAIRRGPLAPPTAGTEVFAMDISSSTNSTPIFTAPFAPDFAYSGNSGTDRWYLSSRLTAGHFLNFSSTAAEGGLSPGGLFYQNGVFNNSFNNYSGWMWKRAPSFFDVVAYSAESGNLTVPHNLGVTPEMIWIKSRNYVRSWVIWHSGLSAGSSSTNHFLEFDTGAEGSANANIVSYSNANFIVGNGRTNTNNTSESGTYIACLFATLAGVSKVGSYTGTGNNVNVDCGFSNGARFILIKRTDDTSDWYVYDSVRGIVAGADPFLLLNKTDAQDAGNDGIDPLSSGFIVTSNSGLNTSNGTYIFYAIA